LCFNFLFIKSKELVYYYFFNLKPCEQHLSQSRDEIKNEKKVALKKRVWKKMDEP